LGAGRNEPRLAIGFPAGVRWGSWARTRCRAARDFPHIKRGGYPICRAIGFFQSRRVTRLFGALFLVGCGRLGRPSSRNFAGGLVSEFGWGGRKSYFNLDPCLRFGGNPPWLCSRVKRRRDRVGDRRNRTPVYLPVGEGALSGFAAYFLLSRAATVRFVGGGVGSPIMLGGRGCRGELGGHVVSVLGRSTRTKGAGGELLLQGGPSVCFCR